MGKGILAASTSKNKKKHNDFKYIMQAKPVERFVSIMTPKEYNEKTTWSEHKVLFSKLGGLNMVSIENCNYISKIQLHSYNHSSVVI